MKYKRKIYTYHCEECGWEALRGEIIPFDLCSKCGNTRPPLVSTEYKEFYLDDAAIDKAKDYCVKILEGADPDELELREKDMESYMFGFLGSVGCYSFCLSGMGADPFVLKSMGKPVVY